MKDTLSSTNQQNGRCPSSRGRLALLFFVLLGLWGQPRAWAYEVIVDSAGATDVANTGNYPTIATRGCYVRRSDRWSTTSSGSAYGGSHLRSSNNDPKEVRWYPLLGVAEAGSYRVEVWHVNSTSTITYTIKYDNGTSTATATINQTTNGGAWREIGTNLTFSGENTEYVGFIKPNNSSNASADAVRFTKLVTNVAPNAFADSLTVAEGGTGTTLSTGSNTVLTNDNDPEGNPITAIKVADPSHGTVTLNSNGTFSYVHDGGETTSDSFTYKARDSQGADSGTVTVSITITPVNDPPTAVADSYVVQEDSANNILTVLTNDTDPDVPANTMTITGVNTAGTHGTVTNDGSQLRFTPDDDYHGTTTFTYTMSDGNGDTSTATVTVTVSELNRPPVANADSFSVAEDSGANSLSVRANDTDPNVGNTLTITSVTAPGHGSTSHNGATVTYTPTANYSGGDTFNYTIRDNDGLTSTAQVTITVTPVNDAPVAVAETITVINGYTTSQLSTGGNSVLTNDSDIDGDPLSAVLVTNVSHGTLTLNSDGTFTYSHDGSAPVTDFFTYKADDTVAYSNTVTVNITIIPNPHQLSPATMSDFTSLPVNMTDSVAPLVMIAASKDHQLFYKAYNDYADLDGDNIADTTYKPTIIYYGYFDSYKCYDYSATNSRFEPKAVAGQVYSMEGTATAFTPASGQVVLNVTSLSGTAGLGPFNNWTVTNLTTGATGSSTTSTNLASSGSKTFTTTATDWISVGHQVRVSVSVASYCTNANDGYWSGNFLNWLSMSRIDTINKVLFGGHRRVDTAADTVLERSYLPHDAHSWVKYYAGNDIAMLTPFISGTDFTLSDADAKKNGISFCNTTDVASGVTKSEEVTDPPLIKAVKGNYSLWAGNERWQCTWGSGATADNHSASNGNAPATSGLNAYSSSPAWSEGIGQKNYVARVQACVGGLIGEEKCKQYPSGNYKPIGLLQNYGDDDQLQFGMVAGSYHKHVSGGTLIKNIESFRNEVNETTDGTFAMLAPAAGGTQAGVTNNNADGIVNAWSLFRIVGYNHSDGTYLGAQYDSCSWGLSAYANVSGANECKNWGNPFSEIYFQGIRYYSDAGVTGTYQDNTSVGIAGLPTPQNWATPNPLGTTNYCARANIIALNSSAASYDNDELDASTPGVKEVWSTSVLPGNDTAAAMTDVVGEGEGIHGGSYFVGELSVDNQSDSEDQLCTPKTVASLGNVGGMCPDSPRLRGSYRIAGIAYYAHTEDVRSSELTGGRALAGIQKIDTYTVTNSSSTPNVDIPHPVTGGTAVRLLPACRNTSLSPPGNCAIVEFKIVSQVVNDGTGKGTGKFYVNWEDSEQGGDYDQDMWGIIEYEINGTTNTLKVVTDVHAKSTGYAMGFGYILNGTTQDGFHAHSGINSFTYTDSNAANITGGTCSGGCLDTNGASTATYSLGAATAELLHEPLWYAAKWGGFIDKNGNDTPDLSEEWDSEDTQGNPTPDSIPDNYFFAHNPQQLEDSLNRVFLKILQRTSSGTAAAVVSNNVRGEGALYQAYYEPQKKDVNGRTVNWIGTLHGLWLDAHGYLREDNGDGMLGNYVDDPVIETYFDEGENRTRAKRWVSTAHDTYTPDQPKIIELGDITPLWNAREQLTFPGLTDNDINTQRPYATTAANGRHIKTWIDSNLNGVVNAGELADFAESAITTSNYTYFDMSTIAEVKGLIKYLRGVETAGYRNRTVDYDGDDVTEVIRLGDIINSTPTMAAAPAEGFDLLYRDASYPLFRHTYKNRRNVLYVGGNDGMLHAFNAGFFTPVAQYVCSTDHVVYSDNSTCVTACAPHACTRDSTPSFSVNGTKIDGNPATAHPLGSELWAYVPMNLQPHLKWLKDPEYTHAYYLDGKPRLFDAKIFPPDATHPNGWGTVLVIGMRFGGGAMTIDTGGDGLHTPSDANDKTRRSAYVVLDITDPEAEPVLLGEIQLPDGSYTTVYPAVIIFMHKTLATPNKWFLALGNGPTSPITGESTTTAKLYLFDLAELTAPGTTTTTPTGCTLATSNSTMQVISCDTGQTNSFVGTPVVVDWDNNYKADSVYFGTVGGTSANKGQLMRFTLNNTENPLSWTGPSTLVDVAQPVYAAPTVAVDSSSVATANKWIYFGTGRLLVDADKLSTTTQSLYGVMDKGITIPKADLVDVSNVDVLTTGGLVNTPVPGVTSFSDLESYILTTNGKGWRMDFPPITGTAGSAPATRMLNQQALLGGILFSSVYQPSLDFCASEGLSRLYGLYYRTGTNLDLVAVFGLEDYVDPAEPTVIKKRSRRFVDLGFGLATAPAIHSGSDSGDSKVTVYTQLSTGTIIREEATTKDKVRSSKKAWRER